MIIRAGEVVHKDLELMWTSEKQYIRRMLIGLTRDIDLADDLLQETYLKARDALAGYRGENGRAWLSAIAKNLFLAHIRLRYVKAEVNGDDASDTLHYSPVGCLDHLELIRVRQAISDLDPDLRTALLMKHYCGFTYSEIAQQAQCPVGTAKWRVSLAVGRLKEMLGIGEEEMEITCADLSRTRILDYLYGALAPDESKAVKRHLKSCRKCQNRLDGTGRVMSALDALEHERKFVQIVELDETGVPIVYAMTRHQNTSGQPSDVDIHFCADKDKELLYLGVQGEELAFTKEENHNPDYPNTYDYHAKLSRPIAPGEWFHYMSIFRPDTYKAVQEPDGDWTFHWSQLTSVDTEWAFVLAVRLPSGANLISAEPSDAEVRNSTVTTTLQWRCIQAPNQGFGCDIKYRLSDNTK